MLKIKIINLTDLQIKKNIYNTNDSTGNHTNLNKEIEE